MFLSVKGGIQEQFLLKQLHPSYYQTLWNILYQAFLKESIMGCAINVRL